MTLLNLLAALLLAFDLRSSTAARCHHIFRNHFGRGYWCADLERRVTFHRIKFELSQALEFQLCIKSADGKSQTSLDDCIGRVDKIGREFLNNFFILPCSFVQVKIVGLVDKSSFQRIYIRSKSELLSERSQEIAESERRLANGEFTLCVLFIFVFFIVM